MQGEHVTVKVEHEHNKSVVVEVEHEQGEEID
jgi:hypothetical protein